MGSLLDLEEPEPSGGARKAAVFTLLASLNNRIQPLDVPAAFSALPQLEAAAATAAATAAAAAAPPQANRFGTRRQPSRSPLDSLVDQVIKGTTGGGVGAIKEKPRRPARTLSAEQMAEYELRAAAAESGGSGGEDSAALAAMMILRLFDADKDGKISRAELLDTHGKTRGAAAVGLEAGHTAPPKNGGGLSNNNDYR